MGTEIENIQFASWAMKIQTKENLKNEFVKRNDVDIVQNEK